MEDNVKKINYLEKLVNKMNAEYEAFRTEVEKLSGREAIQYAYEDIAKRDIMMAVEEGMLSNEEVKALTKLLSPLEICYQDWLRTETDYMQTVRECIKTTADKEVRKKERNER